MRQSKTIQSFELSEEDVGTAVSEFIEKRHGAGPKIKVEVRVGVKTIGMGMSERDTHVVEVSASREAPAVPAPDVGQGGYDPIKDEKKEFTLDEFLHVSRVELSAYADTFRGQNDFHKEKHTWNEWFRSFHEYMSW